MRLWSLHPRYLDARGLVALWREGLLAQAVIRGETRGYLHHPQLRRFQEHPSARGVLAEYLRAVHHESVRRDYDFAAGKISRARASGRLSVTRGQLAFEWQHLMAKLRARDPAWRIGLERVTRPRAHPLFRVVPGGVADWEKGVDSR